MMLMNSTSKRIEGTVHSIINAKFLPGRNIIWNYIHRIVTEIAIILL